MRKTGSSHFFFGWGAVALAAGLAALLAGCRGPAQREAGEIAYVSGAQVEFRNELGPSSRVTGHFPTGERVEILSRRPRWAEVRRVSGETGWVLQRYLVSQQVYDDFAKLAREAEVLPSQGRAIVRRQANLHREPGRTTQAFYQLAEAAEVEVVAHRAVARDESPAASSSEESSGEEEPPAPPKSYEDWLLVRAAPGRAGWLLESSADMNPPLEIAQYREGLRIRAWFEIYREKDADQEHAWYLWATIRKLAGLHYDFDEIRVLVWDPKSSRYETSYRERNLTGFYPIVVENRQTPEGPSPQFRLQLEDHAGQRVEKTYFMMGRQVRVEH